MGRMAPYGSLWLLIAHYGSIWNPMAPFDPLWFPMALYSSHWLHMAHFGSLWLPMDPNGSQWLQMSSYGSICLSYSPTSPPLVNEFSSWTLKQSRLTCSKVHRSGAPIIHESHCSHPLLEPLHGHDGQVETLTLRKTLIFTVLVFRPSYYINIK